MLPPTYWVAGSHVYFGPPFSLTMRFRRLHGGDNDPYPRFPLFNFHSRRAIQPKSAKMIAARILAQRPWIVKPPSLPGIYKYPVRRPTRASMENMKPTMTIKMVTQPIMRSEGRSGLGIGGPAGTDFPG